MSVIALKLLLAPGLVVLASVCGRRFGAVAAGLVGGLPVVAGPILLVLAITHGRDFGADAARAALLGLVSLTTFVVIYGHLSQRRHWTVALPLGWMGFLGVTAILSWVSFATFVGLAVAVASFLVALVVLPVPVPAGVTTSRAAWDLPLRALAATLMVLALTGASKALGPHLSGLLAPFPVIASVLTAFTHAQEGGEEALALLRGMLLGFFGFAAFCATVAAALPHSTVAGTFAIACGAALAMQSITLTVRWRRRSCCSRGAGHERLEPAGG